MTNSECGMRNGASVGAPLAAPDCRRGIPAPMHRQECLSLILGQAEGCHTPPATDYELRATNREESRP